jgi:hypothetical protein
VEHLNKSILDLKMVRIGWTFDTYQLKDSFFTNGLKQNVVFLYQLLDKIGYDPFFIYFEPLETKGTVWEPYRFASLNDNVSIDILMVAMYLPSSNIIQGLRTKGVKIIYYNMGHKYIPFVEASIHSGKDDRIASDKTNLFDEVWCIPNYTKNKFFLEIVYGCPIKEAPYIWSPFIIEQIDVSYKPSPVKKVGCFEPNMSTTKHSIQVLVYMQHLIDLVDKVYLFCMDELIRNNEFERYVLGHASSKKIFFEKRYPLPHVLQKYVNVCVGYQKENELNYLYLDILWLGFPLIHNSPMMKDIGFYYETSDQFKSWMQYVITEFDSRHEEYKSKWREIIAKKYMHQEEEYKKMLI